MTWMTAYHYSQVHQLAQSWPIIQQLTVATGFCWHVVYTINHDYLRLIICCQRGRMSFSCLCNMKFSMCFIQYAIYVKWMMNVKYLCLSHRGNHILKSTKQVMLTQRFPSGNLHQGNNIRAAAGFMPLSGRNKEDGSSCKDECPREHLHDFQSIPAVRWSSQ